jgi:hypothetical protein
MRQRVKNYEEDYYHQREVEHKSDIEAREHAINVQYKGLPKSKVMKLGAKFDSIEDPAHQDGKSVPRQQPRRRPTRRPVYGTPILGMNYPLQPVPKGKDKTAFSRMFLG